MRTDQRRSPRRKVEATERGNLQMDDLAALSDDELRAEMQQIEAN